MKIYLAGSKGNWRDILKAEFPDIEFFDPFATRPLKQWISEFALKDFTAIEECDIVIIYVNYPVYTGACVEAGYAAGLGKPIFLIFELKDRLDPMLVSISQKVFTDFIVFVNRFRKFIKGKV